MKYHVLDEPCEYPYNGWCDCGRFVYESDAGYLDTDNSPYCED